MGGIHAWRRRSHLMAYKGVRTQDFIARSQNSLRLLEAMGETKKPLLVHATGFRHHKKGNVVEVEWLERDDNVTKAVLAVGTRGKGSCETQVVLMGKAFGGGNAPYKWYMIPVIDSATLSPEARGPAEDESPGAAVLPLSDPNVVIKAKLVDKDGLESNSMEVLFVPQGVHDRFGVLSSQCGETFYPEQKAYLWLHWLLDVDPSSLPTDPKAWNKLHGMIQLWASHRAVQWLEGHSVPRCYAFAWLTLAGAKTSAPPEVSEQRPYTPLLLRILRANMDQPFYEFTFPPIIMPVMPSSKDQPWKDYVEMLKTHPQSRDYINAIEEAEKRSPDLRALMEQEAAEKDRIEKRWYPRDAAGLP